MAAVKPKYLLNVDAFFCILSNFDANCLAAYEKHFNVKLYAFFSL